eukprot:251833-Amphidinium_carterae.1
MKKCVVSRCLPLQGVCVCTNVGTLRNCISRSLPPTGVYVSTRVEPDCRDASSRVADRCLELQALIAKGELGDARLAYCAGSMLYSREYRLKSAAVTT